MQPVSLIIGGIKREIRPEIALALKIERVTGVGAVELGRRAVNAEISLTAAVDIIAVALQHSGVENVTSETVTGYAATDGLVNTVMHATRIINALFEHESKAKNKKAANGPLVTAGQ